VYSERPDDWEHNLVRLEKKHETARTLVPRAIVDKREGAEIGIIAYGSTHDAIEEARDQLRAEGIETSYCRVRALPFEDTLREFIDSHKRLYVVELSIEGQLRSLIRLYAPDRSMDFHSVAHLDGLPMTASYVKDGIQEQEKK
jgi:2-oxoglutarate ferredoxin oxidoreductase subunit alpha